MNCQAHSGSPTASRCSTRVPLDWNEGRNQGGKDPIRKDLAELQTTLQEAKAVLADMQVMVRANDYKIGDTVENLRVATDNLDQLTDSLKQRPWSLIRIKQPKEREVPH